MFSTSRKPAALVALTLFGLPSLLGVGLHTGSHLTSGSSCCGAGEAAWLRDPCCGGDQDIARVEAGGQRCDEWCARSRCLLCDFLASAKLTGGERTCLRVGQPIGEPPRSELAAVHVAPVAIPAFPRAPPTLL